MFVLSSIMIFFAWLLASVPKFREWIIDSNIASEEELTDIEKESKEIVKQALSGPNCSHDTENEID